MTTVADIHERLTEIRPPGSSRDIVAAGMVRGIEASNGTVTIRIEAAALAPQSLDVTIADIRRAVGAMEGVSRVHVHVAPAATENSGAPSAGAAFSELGPLPGVQDIVAVASTKGGVGKSTVATNLALALGRLGQRVGLLDADVYGPSLPIMLGVSGRPRAAGDKRILPLEKYGLQLMSIGFFLDEQSPVIWRGPLVMGVVRQFLRDVEWKDLDVLVIDLPPGTGDAPLTLVQQVPLAGGVVVTTPQDVATLDVQRGVAMFQQVNTPVFGIVENMAHYRCPRCGTRDDLFGSGGGQRIAQRFGVPLLAQIPLLPEIRSAGDDGKPIVIDRPEHPVSALFVQLASRVLEAVAAERQQAAPTILT